MEWVSRIADQKDEAARKQENIRAGSNALFLELTRRANHALETYNRRIQRLNNEKAYLDVQTVRLGTQNPAGAYVPTPDSPSIALAFQPPRTITATYSGGQSDEVFTVHENDMKYLHLEHNNQTISIDQATEIILARFLFGEATGG